MNRTEEKRVTIKDSARETQYSIASIHCALNGKPGVSEEARQYIRETAQRMGYRPNSVAVSLKRKAVKIAVALPGPTADNRYYYTGAWKGVRDYIGGMKDFNIQLIEAPYYEDSGNDQHDELIDLLENYQIDGLITVGYMDMRGKISLQRFTQKHIPMVLVGNDQPQSGRICCVQPNYDVIGRVLAELMLGRVPADRAILISAGDMMIPSHYLIVEGFENYLKEKRAERVVYKVHDSENGNEESFEKLLRLLQQKEDIGGCFSANTRGSVRLGRAIEQSGKAGSIVAVGSDLFLENIEFLKNGVFSNLFLKNPYAQSYMAAKYLTEYLLREQKPVSEIVYVGSEIIFQSSLPMYEGEQGGLNGLLL